MFSYDNLLLVMTGSSIFTVGVLALCAHFSSAALRERTLLWFGLFAAPYGLALVCRSVLIPQWDGSAEQIIVAVFRGSIFRRQCRYQSSSCRVEPRA
jgi:hypothetical protein